MCRSSIKRSIDRNIYTIFSSTEERLLVISRFCIRMVTNKDDWKDADGPSDLLIDEPIDWRSQSDFFLSFKRSSLAFMLCKILKSLIIAQIYNNILIAHLYRSSVVFLVLYVQSSLVSVIQNRALVNNWSSMHSECMFR